jgi:dipeptidyl aminopeptidase/acylaminoacyl peptidase
MQAMKLMTTWQYRIAATVLLAALFTQAAADREPVLRQIKVPHDYYFREMFLPQVSTGPQGAAWSPDGRSLVYAMQGSLWRQDLESTTAVQLTAGPGYDHQPDFAPDGRSIVFARYDRDAVELQLLDLESAEVRPLTANGAVNVQPRFSPDGKRIAFVSTMHEGRFHVFTGEIHGGSLRSTPVARERKSEVERYYYSEFDHELSPAWMPDGSGLVYVANPEIPYGSGAIWRHSFAAASTPELIRKEETTWRASPDVDPSGRRMIYASYLGRQWHQLWITAIGGSAEPFPLTYGEYDIAGPRWSPQGDRIAFTANEHGNTELRVMQLPGGRVTPIRITERRYLRPTGTLQIALGDAGGEPTRARVAVTGVDGRAYAPHEAWAHADDGFDRTQRRGEARYFHAEPESRIEVPAGPAEVTVWRGPESQIGRYDVVIEPDAVTRLAVTVRPLDLPPEWAGWHSGDTHVHMNYGGAYRNTPANLVRQAEAEDLDLVFNLIVNKEQRVPDVGYFSGRADAASSRQAVVQHSQEFHTGFWGHVGLLGLSSHLLLPDYAAYPETAAASLFPDNATVARLAREQGAISGYVHPFLYPLPDPESDASLTNALPVDAALGLVDYYEVLGFADHRASAEIWYRLLNLGIRISAAGGTDAMANFASLRGPVGVNRTYVQTPAWPAGPDRRRDLWIDGLRAGRSMATNGPLLGFTVNDEVPGATLALARGERVGYRGFLRSAVPVDRLEVVFNGAVVERVALSGDALSADFDGTLAADTSGWLLLRASAAKPHPDLFDMYAYATTSPVYLEIGDGGIWSAADADYFLRWIERIREAAVGHDGYNSGAERDAVLRNIDAAASRYRDRVGGDPAASE